MQASGAEASTPGAGGSQMRPLHVMLQVRSRGLSADSARGLDHTQESPSVSCCHCELQLGHYQAIASSTLPRR